MTTTVKVTAPGYVGKKAVVCVNDGGSSQWKKHTVLEAGQDVEVVAHDGQAVCVIEMSDEEFANSHFASEG